MLKNYLRVMSLKKKKFKLIYFLLTFKSSVSKPNIGVKHKKILEIKNQTDKS